MLHQFTLYKVFANADSSVKVVVTRQLCVPSAWVNLGISFLAVCSMAEEGKPRKDCFLLCTTFGFLSHKQKQEMNDIKMDVVCVYCYTDSGKEPLGLCFLPFTGILKKHSWP